MAREKVALENKNTLSLDFSGGPGVKNSLANAGDMGLIPGLGGCHRANKPMSHKRMI